MNIDFFIFYFFASFALISVLMVITLTNAVHSVLFLILVFCNITGLLLLLGVEFFSFMFLIVYVGAIAVLFLFVVMMLNIKIDLIKINKLSIEPIAIICFSYLTLQIILLIDNSFLLVKNKTIFYTLWLAENNYLTNTETIGLVLYTKYSLLFLLCSIILLVAMIGAIVLTMHQRSNVKKQQISNQLLRNSCGVIKFIQLRK